MNTEIDFSDENIKRLKDFIKQNPTANFKLYNLNDQVAAAELNWSGFEEVKEPVISILMAYQRMLRIMPENKGGYAFTFLKNRVHSSMQIASMSMKQFMSAASDIIPDDMAAAEEIYNRAMNRRSTILVQYMDILQNSEPHISAARFN